MKQFCLILICLTINIKFYAQTSNTSPLPAGETVIGGHLHAGAGNELWTDAGSLFFNYRGAATTTHFWNLGGGSGKSIMTLLSNGNVGIGTVIPSTNLEIAGGTTINPTSPGNNYLLFKTNGTSLGIIGSDASISGTNSQNMGMYVYGNNSLEFWTNSTRRLVIDGNGNLGIGNLNPRSKLSVKDGYIESTITKSTSEGMGLAGISLTVRSSINEENLHSKWVMYTAAPDGGFGVGARNYEIWEYPENLANGNCCRRRFVIENSNGKANGGLFYLNSDGNVLINKTTQTNITYRLDVAGKIRADEIVINTTGADFVFDPTYKLPTLSELEAFIKAHKHLPGIAPAKEMQENGVSAGEMQTKLLQKVEELTLYILQQEEKIKSMQHEINQLKNKK